MDITGIITKYIATLNSKLATGEATENTYRVALASIARLEGKEIMMTDDDEQLSAFESLVMKLAHAKPQPTGEHYDPLRHPMKSFIMSAWHTPSERALT